MAELRTIARPYAKAAFAEASASGEVAAWSGLLAQAAAVVASDEFGPLVGNPQVDQTALADLLHGAADGAAGKSGSSFLKLLAERGRLSVLPAIRDQFEALRAEADNRVDVELITAIELDEGQKRRFADAMHKRLGRDVVIHARTDASILGGAVVRAGDLVIDGSVKGRLDKLAVTLGH